jgi:hypothetical protein
MSANADEKYAGFFIASAHRRCQAIEKIFSRRRAQPRNVTQNQRASKYHFKKSMEMCGLSD